MTKQKSALTKKDIEIIYNEEVKNSQSYGDQIRAQVKRDKSLSELKK